MATIKSPGIRFFWTGVVTITNGFSIIFNIKSIFKHIIWSLNHIETIQQLNHLSITSQNEDSDEEESVIDN